MESYIPSCTYLTSILAAYVANLYTYVYADTYVYYILYYM